MKKDPPSVRSKKGSSLPNIKLICRINGALQPNPPSGKLHYVGGETRIVSVDRNVGFLQLVSKISQPYPNISSFSIKYKLPESNDSDEDTPLVSITTDEDVRCMIEEYDKAECHGKKHTRLWVFVCSNDWYAYQDSSFNGFSSDLHPKNTKIHIAEIHNCEDFLRKVVGCRNFSGLNAVEASEPKTQNSYNPFREPVCIPQFQTSQTSRLVQFNSGGDLGVGANISTQFPFERFSESMVCRGGGNAGIFNQLVATTPREMDMHNISAVPMCSGWNGNPGWRNSEEVSMGNSNYGNVIPQAAYCNSVQRSCAPTCNNQYIGRVYQKKSSVSSNRGGSIVQLRSRVHRNGAADTRNHRTSPYHIRSHRNNLREMGNGHGIGFDGKAYSGKSYHGLRPSSNICKHGQAMRSNYSHLWKPRFSFHDNAWEGMVDSNKPTQPSFNMKNSNGISTKQIEKRTGGRCAFSNLSRQNDYSSAGFDSSIAHMNHLAHDNMNHIPFSSQLIESHYPSFRAMNTQEELLDYPNDGKSRKSESMKNVHGTYAASVYVPVNSSSVYPDLNRDPSFLSSQKNPEISMFYMEGWTHGTKFDQKLQLDTMEAAITSSNDRNDVGNLSGAVISSVDLSLHKLSLSSSKGVKSPTSSLASNDISESSPVSKTIDQPNLLDLMDEGQLSPGPLVEKSSGEILNFSVESAAVLKKNLSHRKDTNHGSPSSLITDEKDDSNGSRTYLKDVGGKRNELVAFYTDLAARELQTIKNSDLEDIRELGSGTYGNVFYGKWKGSDVAIKRIKPTCFSGGQLEENRLIADFWKEAHILGQLHHPNVVSFYGVVKDGPVTNLATVTEYMVNGSLKQVLMRKDRTIDRRKRLLIAMDAAFGMEYLHEKNIVHFDLKSHNFLMNMKDPLRPVCKIGDMGLSKVKQKTLVSGGVRGTISWMAPELLTSENNMVTEKVDVYSFGIVMWELLTGEEPYAHMPTEETIVGIIRGDLRPEIPSWCDPMWRSLMERCWSSNPGSRPSFSDIAKELRSMATTINIK